MFNEQNERVAWARSRVIVSPMKSAATEPLTVLFVGDSLTHASVYPQRVVELGEQPGARRIQLIGTHVPGENLAIRHEGYGGWTAQRFATHFLPQARQGEAKLRGSPFLYKSEDQPPRLDFQRYCADANAGAWPDIVAIFLGPNDIFELTEETLEVGLDGILGHYDQLVTLFRDSNPRTKVAVLLPVPPAATQDAFGANYAAGQTRWQYKRNQHRMIERLRAQ